MIKDQPMTLRMAAYALDPAAMLADALGIPAVDEWQAQALRSPSKRQLYLTSRQVGKSSVAACKALHTAMFKPDSTVLLMSYRQEQSQEIFKRGMDQWRQLGRPIPVRKGSELRAEFVNGSRIIALPGSDMSVVGYTADLVVIDEAARTPSELFQAAYPMVAVTDGSIVAISTPKGARGWFYNLWVGNDPAWERYRLPANECPRIPVDLIEQVRSAEGERAVREQFFCSFEADTEAFFRGEDVDRTLTLADNDRPPLFPEACAS